jgi:carbon-monoxide dehydrogenase medium subunit
LAAVREQNRAPVVAEALIPNSAEEAAKIYGDGAGITVVGGGTILLPEIAQGTASPGKALLLHRSGLDTVTSTGGVVVIGPMVTVKTLAEGPDGVLRRFAEHVADAEVRGSATIGGNICAPPGARGGTRGDLGAALIALGARVRSTGSGGARLEPVEDFLADDRSRRLVLAIEHDDVPRRWAVDGMRRRHAHSYVVAAVAICERDGELRIGAAGVGPTAVRCRTVEQTRDPADVLRDVDPADDAVASAAYRRKVLPMLVGRALGRLAEK